MDVLTSDVLLVPGDSGGPLYSRKPGVGRYRVQLSGGGAVAYAQPLASLEQEIKAGGGRYGRGLSVYTQR